MITSLTTLQYFTAKIWLNLLMDDHQFDYIANFTAKIWLNLLMDDHQFGYVFKFHSKNLVKSSYG
jgi:hypothetical protein